MVYGKKIYADYSATTPIREEVLEFMHEIGSRFWGNPSSQHYFGREARNVIEESRERVAELLDCLPERIIFTSGGTESNNLAIQGVLRARDKGQINIISTPIEHPSIMKLLSVLEHEGRKVHYLKVDEYGVVNLDHLQQLLEENRDSLVIAGWGNSEVGSLNPVDELVSITCSYNAYFFTDAVQVAGRLPVSIAGFKSFLCSLSSHKLYGPKGVGALYVDPLVPFEPLIYGGEQERGIRAGTENLTGIAGFGYACHLVKKEIKRIRRHLSKLEDFLRSRLQEIEGIVFLGHPLLHIPGFVAFYIPGISSAIIAQRLDLAGIAVSSGTACSSGTLQPSYVLETLGVSPAKAENAIRITFGKYSTMNEARAIAEQVIKIVAELREQV